MTNENRARFAELMLGMGETFNEPVTEVRAGAYFDALIDLPIEAIESAVRMIVRSSRFFPKPVELREAVEGNKGDEAAMAWAEFQREVSRVGYMREPSLSPATMETVRVVFGGWRRACSTLPSSDSERAPELMNWRKQFCAVYGDMKRRQEFAQLTEGAPHLKGMLAAVKSFES